MEFLSQCTQRAVRDVFNTMLSLHVELVSSTTEVPLAASPIRLSGMVSVVGFAGQITGSLYFNCSERGACLVTERLFGAAPADCGAPEVADVMGEMANMVAGAMKALASQRGYNGWLSTPTVFRGHEIQIEPKDAPIATFDLFQVQELEEQIGVHTFARLSA